MKEIVYASDNERLLATGKMPSLFMRYAIPGAVSLIFLSLQSIIDGIVVGNFIGADALASVNLIMPGYSLLMSIAIMLGIGSQALMSIGFGEKNYAGVKDTMKTGFISILVIGLLFSVVISAFAPQIAGLLGANDALLSNSVGYIYGLIPFAPVIAVMFYFDYVLKALGHPRFAMYVMTSTVVLNLLLSVFFVTRLDMGTFGVGLATGISFTIGIVFSAVTVWKQIKSLPTLTAVKGRFRFKTLWQIFYNGSSEGVSELAAGFSLFLFNLALMQYAGKEGVAAFAVINYIIFIGTSLFLGISDGIISIISYNFGAKLWGRIREAMKIAIGTNFVIGLLFIAVLWGFGESIISLFINDSDAAVVDIAVQGSHILGWAFLLNGFNIFAASFFTAMNNAKISLIIATLRGMVFVALGIFIFPKLMGINGIWITTPFAEVMTFGVSLLLVKRVARKGQDRNA